MTKNLPANTLSAIESALIQGDLKQLNSEQRLSYYKQVCDSVGLNPLTKPFEYITLNGKLTLYALRAATDQLRNVHKVSIKITDRTKIDDIYIVTAQATNSEGRFDESTGAVNVAGLKGEALANAYLKAETKAKRRVTLSLCGLGLLDETEVADIPDSAKDVTQAHATESKPLMTAPKAETVFQTDVPEGQEPPETPEFDGDPGEYRVTFGRKYKGKKLKEIPKAELDSYIKWLEGSDIRPGTTLSHQLHFLKNAFLKLHPLKLEGEDDNRY